jgi:hypothetical protein
VEEVEEEEEEEEEVDTLSALIASASFLWNEMIHLYLFDAVVHAYNIAGLDSMLYSSLYACLYFT